MHQIRILAAAALLSLVAPGAFAQSAKDIAGSWTLVSSTIQQGGNRIQPFGADPKGSLIFEATAVTSR